MFDAGCNPQPLMHREMHTPTVATDHQSVKRDKMRGVPEPNGHYSREQVAMDSASEDAGESSLGGPSLRRLLACPKRDRIGAWHGLRDQGSPPQNPVCEYHPTATQNDQQERGNGCSMLYQEQVSTAYGAFRGLPNKQMLEVTLKIG